MAEAPINLSVFISPIAYIICFTGCIVLLSMVKSFVTYGVSIAVTEWLLNHSDDEERLKIVRWFANGNDILRQLNKIDQKIAPTNAKASD